LNPTSPNPAATPIRASSGYIPTLDGWRAIAIVLVLCAHGGMFFFSDHGPHPSARLESWSSRGSAGVDIFFAISGFLICTLLLREQTKTGTINLKSFYTRRVFRILPPYLLYMAALAILCAVGLIIVTPHEWLASFFFFRNYMPLQTMIRDKGWYTGHFWSLAVEEHFYLIWPGLLLLLRPRRATITAVLLIIAIAIWRVIDLRYHLLPLWCYERFDHRTDVRLDSLLWGCLFAMAFNTTNGLRSLQRLANPIIWLASALGILVLTSNFFDADRSYLRFAFASTLLPPLYAILVISTVVKPHWVVAKMLEDPRLRWIGRASYSLYIWQQLFLVVQLVPRPLPFGKFQEVPLAFLCIFACATASYYLVEQPLIKIGHRISRAQSSSAISSPIPSKAAAAASSVAGSSAA
jgi:peptidoglycan/LPS O-acetylase OafA/YrhL